MLTRVTLLLLSLVICLVEAKERDSTSPLPSHDRDQRDYVHCISRRSVCGKRGGEEEGWQDGKKGRNLGSERHKWEERTEMW